MLLPGNLTVIPAHQLLRVLPQSGDVNLYLFYVFLVILLAYLLGVTG